MPSFERVRMGVAVAAAAVVLVFSTVAAHTWSRFIPETTAPEDIASVQRGVEILEHGRSPLVGMQPCDAVKSLLPDRFTREDGDRKIVVWSPADVILCFRGSIDYGEGLSAAASRGLTWQRGLGGSRIVVFAPSEARFRQVAQMNNLTIGPGDLSDADPLLFRLQPHMRAIKVKDGWSIQPGGSDEVLFGPYATRPPGRYRLLLGFEPEANITCPVAMPAIGVQASVTVNARAAELAPPHVVTLTPSTSASGHCLLTGEVDFSTSAPATNIETPIWVRNGMPVRLTQYSLQRVEQP